MVLRALVVSSIISFSALAGCKGKAMAPESGVNKLGIVDVMKLASDKCEGDSFSENRISCLVAEKMYATVDAETSYRCLIVVHNQLVLSNSLSLNSLSPEAVLSWGRLADLKYEAMKGELTQLQQDFIVKDAEKPMNLSRWSKSCFDQYILAERDLRQSAFSREEK